MLTPDFNFKNLTTSSSFGILIKYMIYGEIMNKRRYWTNQEVLDLRNYYPDKPKEWLENYFAREWRSIKDKASKERIAKNKGNEGLTILLNDSLQSVYWMGFLLADGHIADSRIQIELSQKDSEHLKEFAKYVKTSNWYERERILNSKIYYQNSVHVNNIAVVSKLINKYDINSNKTKNPPEINKYDLTSDQFIALFIGFVDGDGNLRKQRNCEKLRIECCASWYNNLLFFENLLYNYFTLPKKVEQLTKVSARGSAVLEISNPTLIRMLKRFITHNRLYAMKRKWDIVSNIT